MSNTVVSGNAPGRARVAADPLPAGHIAGRVPERAVVDSRSPVDSDRIPSEIGSQAPSSLGSARLFSFLRNTPPFAPPANK
jgi:hypothetical protein